MSDLTQSEKNVFGHDAKRGADGKIVESGIGSPPIDPMQAAHHAANHVKVCAADVETITKSLTEATARLIEASKDATAAAHAAFVAKPAVVEPAPHVDPVVHTSDESVSEEGDQIDGH